MTIGLIILIVFLVAAILMFLRKLPALLALPLMAIAIAAIEVFTGKLTVQDLMRGVIADGAIRLADPMVISMFGGMLSILMQKTGVAESFVRRGAELAGDNPWVVTVVMLFIITMLFTTIGGLGAVIMVGTIVLPILASIGVREYIAAGIMVFGISLGGLLNAGNWVVYRTVLSIESDLVSSYALMVFLCSSVVGAGFVTLELWRTRILRVRNRSAARAIGALIIISCLVYLLFSFSPGIDGEWIGTAAKWVAGIIGIALVAYVAIDILRRKGTPASAGVRWYAYLIPLVPLFLILVFDVAFLAAFLCGLAYGVLSTYRRGMLNLTTRSIIEGSSSVIPAVVLMVGIGMLLSAILGPTATGPGRYWHDQQTVSQSLQTESPSGVGQNQKEWPVLTDMKPLLSAVVPGSFLAYILTFALLGPFALYRGPLNVWGLGYGVGGILLATGMPAGAVMGILLSMGMIQGVSDPTNTANVWIANEVRLDVNTIMWRTLPYSWLAAILGLIIAGFRFVL